MIMTIGQIIPSNFSFQKSTCKLKLYSCALIWNAKRGNSYCEGEKKVEVDYSYIVKY